MKRRAANFFAWCAFIFTCSNSLALSAETSKPLTLAAALATAGEAHPDLAIAEAERDTVAAERDFAAARQDVTVTLEGILRSGRPTSNESNTFQSDNSVRLTARKNLYDFGRAASARQAAQLEFDSRQLSVLETHDQRRIEIMSRFFEVLLADLQFTVDDETMAVAYVRVENARDRLENGQISKVDLSEIEHAYQEVLVKRSASQKRQRITRALLANAMNRSGDLAADLDDPMLSSNNRAVAEYETMVSIMLANNPRLRAQQTLVEATQKRLEALRAETSPTLDAEVEAADYRRSAAARDRLRAGLILTWPLYQGNRIDARLAREQAQFHKLQANNEKLKMELNQALLETLLEIEQLQKTVRGAAQKQSESSDLLLEKSRGLYEMELKTNLGDSMAATIAAKLRQRKTEYQLALAFAKLEALLGQPLPEIKNVVSGEKAK